MPTPQPQPQAAPQMPQVDTASMIVSYLFSNGGRPAILHELMLALQKPPEEIAGAVDHLEQIGYVDRSHGELPAVAFTQEAIAALMAHTQRGMPLPERIMRASDRDRMAREQAAGAQQRMATVLEQVLEEQRRTRIELQQLRQLPGAQNVPRLGGPGHQP